MPVLERLGDIADGEGLTVLEIGQRPRNTTYAVESTRGKPNPRARGEQHSPGVAVEHGMAIQVGRSHSRVAGRPLRAESLTLARPRDYDAFSYNRGAFPVCLTSQRRQLDRRNVDHQIEAIQKRSR